ncbi:cation transporter [Clostridia bacterium]|nr:cation transporter [Clostridia bacterium]
MKKQIKKNKAILAALAANTIIALMKFIIAAFSNSASLFSEAIHSSADALNQIVLLIGKKQGKKSPDAKHQFGHARATFFASFCVAALLFFVGGVYSGMEAIEKISHTLHETGEHVLDMTALLIAAGILILSIILEIFSLRTALKEVEEEQEKNGSSSRGLIKFYKETRNSSLIVIVTEDLTAIFGLGLALTGVVLTLITGNPLWDAIGGVAIGFLLIVAAFILGKEIASLIIGESLPTEKVKEIENLINQIQFVQCKQVKSVAIGEECIVVEVDVIFKSELSTKDITTAIQEIKQKIKRLWGNNEDIHVSTCIEAVTA